MRCDVGGLLDGTDEDELGELDGPPRRMGPAEILEEFPCEPDVPPLEHGLGERLEELARSGARLGQTENLGRESRPSAGPRRAGSAHLAEIVELSSGLLSRWSGLVKLLYSSERA